MLLNFFVKIGHFSSQRLKNDYRPLLFLLKKHIFAQQIQLEPVMRCSRICRKVSTKLNKIPLQLRKRFWNWFFSGKKIRKEFSGSVESSYDQSNDFFRSKFHFFKAL